MDKEIVPVGDSARLEVIFHTSGYNRRVTKSPVIYTNEGGDTATIYHRVSITTDVTPLPDSTRPIVIAPPKIDLYQSSGSLVDSAGFSITNVSGLAVDLSLVVVPNEYFEVTLPMTIADGETAEGFIRIKPGALTQSFEKSLTLEADGPGGTRYTVPVKQVYSAR